MIQAMRPLIDLGYRVRRRVLSLLRWRTRGVKVMAFDAAERLLLVRHRYGRSDLWMLPGGGIGRRESPGDAAVREMAEETGCTLDAATLIGRFEARQEGRRDTVFLFRGTIRDAPVADGVELVEARLFGLDALPAAVSPATTRRIAEYRGAADADGRW